ncbi:nickel-binding protein [Pseudonocardia sichuanensis]
MSEIVLANTELGVAWLCCFVNSGDKRLFCMYEPANPEAIRKAGRRTGLPIEVIHRGHRPRAARVRRPGRMARPDDGTGRATDGRRRGGMVRCPLNSSGRGISASGLNLREAMTWQ